MANPTESSDQGDSLASFEPEPAGQRRDGTVGEFDGEASGPPPIGAVSFDHVRSTKGFGFVEGVALIQAATEAVAAAGRNGGVPELHGLLLNSAGEVVLHGPPTGDPPARELARLLHELVAPELMPPAGRLFVGRWINNDQGDLKEFSSELAYFARPNGQEILVGLHGRCDRNAVPQTVASVVRRPERPREPVHAETPKREAPQNILILMQKWVRDHKPEMTAAIAVIASMTIAGLGTWFWQASTVAAAKAPAETPKPQNAETVAGSEDKGADVLTLAAAGTTAIRPAPAAKRGAAPGAAGRNSTSPAKRGTPEMPTQPLATTPAAPAQAAVVENPPPATPPQLPSTPIPDMRIYTVSDASVEPPILRSSEILEVLITGFQTRENVIELVISEKGEVQQARMVEAPQRIPDVMLLSRAKELHFDPALRNGVPVRYRLRLSWKVTP